QGQWCLDRTAAADGKIYGEGFIALPFQRNNEMTVIDRALMERILVAKVIGLLQYTIIDDVGIYVIQHWITDFNKPLQFLVGNIAQIQSQPLGRVAVSH